MPYYLINTYRYPSKLFIAGGDEILSREGTTQGDPTTNQLTNITIRKGRLGAVIGSKKYKKEYCENVFNNWLKELKTLCDIAET